MEGAARRACSNGRGTAMRVPLAMQHQQPRQKGQLVPTPWGSCPPATAHTVTHSVGGRWPGSGSGRQAAFGWE